MARIPTFSDWGIGNPEPFTADPRVIRLVANIRYTSNASWVVVRGRLIRKHGYEQFHDLASRLTHRTEFAGPEFSAGDKYIADCATRAASAGNLETWRRVGTNHHLTLVTKQIAKLSAT